jgi:hypothetical protein
MLGSPTTGDPTTGFDGANLGSSFARSSVAIPSCPTTSAGKPSGGGQLGRRLASIAMGLFAAGYSGRSAEIDRVGLRYQGPTSSTALAARFCKRRVGRLSGASISNGIFPPEEATGKPVGERFKEVGAEQ